MSHRLETDNEKNDRYTTTANKSRRSICSIDGCTLQVQRKNFCAKHLSSYNKSKKTSRINYKKTQDWSTSHVKEFSNDNSTIDVNKIKQIFSKFQHHLHQDLNDKTFPHLSSSKLKTEDDTKSENSIEYDYTYTTTNNQSRHVSIATIYLQDEQWHQLELFIKHFSTYASLSNNLNVNSSTTHLLIDDSLHPNQCIFSKKIFQAVARRIYIVSIRWINECLLRNEIVDETPFEIYGDGTMATMHLARRSATVPLFSSSISFAIDCNSFQRVLTRHDLAELALLSGASLFDLEREEQVSRSNQIKILFVLADPTTNRYQLENKYKKYHKNIKYLTPGFLLKSIVYQKQQPFEDFEL